MSQSDADRSAAAAVRAHHTELAATLAGHVAALKVAATGADPELAGRRREALTGWLRAELLPHATAEEAGLYPAAAAQPGGRLLVDGMLAEHRAIGDLVAELEAAATPVAAAAAARGLSALFDVHLAKENDLVLPLLLAAADTSLAALLEGMHDLLGHGAVAHGGAEHGAAEAGCGGGGSCGCGGDSPAAATAAAPVLTVDARLDVRDVPHRERHARVLAALDALPPDGGLVLVAPHAPRPLLAEIDARFPGQFDTEWLQEGPDVWQLRLHRQPATV